MKNLKVPCTASSFISKQNISTNFNSFNYIAVGQYDNDEFRGLLEFNLNPRIFDFKIRRADLVIYLNNSKIDLNIEAFMLNIARNFDKFNSDKVTWETAPRFFQEANFSKIKSDYCKSRIIIDITKILEYWMKNRISIFGLTLLGLTQSSLIYITNTVDQKPFLEIFLDNTNFCDSHNRTHSNFSNHYSEQNPLTHTSNNSNFSYSSHEQKHLNYSQDINYENITNNDLLNQNINCRQMLNHPTSTNLLAYGNFINNNGELLFVNSTAYIKFDFENNTNRTNLNISNDGIFILIKGLYKIDYFINCRSEPFSTVELELDGKSIPFTQVQISSGDAITSSSTIIDVSENNMILKLKLSTSNSILINTGICASLTLIKIN
ncbi:MAG: DNRLRE domain-containing protein [Sarcina sp.]